MIDKFGNSKICFILRLFLVIIILLFNFEFVLAQDSIKVITARGKIAVINAGSDDGIFVGEKFVLLRKSGRRTIEVGIVRVVKVLQDKSGIRLIESRQSDYIEIGDLIGDAIDNFPEHIPDTPTRPVDSSRAIYEAEQAAERDANKIMWYGMGCLLGPIGWLISEAGSPSPKAASLVGKDPEYIALYTDAYRSKIKKIRSTASLYGCLIGTGITVLVYALLLAEVAEAESQGYY